MVTNRSIFCFFLLVSITEAFFFYYSEESFYTTVVSTTYEIYEQDRLDAKYIIEQKLSEEAFASILPYRKKIRCMTIIREIATQSGGNEYVADNYVPREGNSTPFRDLVYVLTKDENIVLGGYLEYYFKQKDETPQIIAMTLTKDMMQMIATYDKYHAPTTFKELRKDQRRPYENMLRVWVEGNRAPGSQAPLDSEVSTDGDDLRNEYFNNGWEEDRDVIEKVLMKNSIPHAQKSIAWFEEAAHQTLESAIAEKLNSDKLHDIGDSYSALTRYIKNRPKYISDIMFQYSDGSDNWAVWNMCIAVNSANDWKAINEIFQKEHSQSLSQFITAKMTNDKTMAEMIAVIVDPAFKPTKFQMKALTPGAGPNDNVTAAATAAAPAPAAAGTPPPVPPTNVAPPPAATPPPPSG